MAFKFSKRFSQGMLRKFKCYFCSEKRRYVNFMKVAKSYTKQKKTIFVIVLHDFTYKMRNVIIFSIKLIRSKEMEIQ